MRRMNDNGDDDDKDDGDDDTLKRKQRSIRIKHCKNKTNQNIKDMTNSPRKPFA